jgi:uroporphyrin-III C-methyltransferase/precorrin-2 dehydrogenase/sirohydrochlorin ferrochelatase
VFYALDGKRVVLAGGSQAAAWKAELLSAAGAQVDVYAEEISDDMLMLLADPLRGIIVHHQRAWAADDFRDAAMAVGAFDDQESAAAFAAAARAAGVPVNVIDKPAFCDFSFGAIVNRSPLVIGVSTDGAAPVFAQAIRAKLEAMLPKGFAGWAKAASNWRAAVQASGLTFAGRRSFWQRFTAQAMQTPERAPAQSDFDRFLAGVTATTPDNGSVTLVGAGPGDAELLTLRAVRALQSADVILFDDLVSAEVLDFARREARKMLVGKTGFGPSCRQEDINELMVSLAKQGKRVVRLKGGDPLIFARAGEELAACREAGIAVEVVPGITAAQGAAARLGLPLTDRDYARRLQYITAHAKSGELPDDIDLKALADPVTTTAIYMPVRTLAVLADKAIAAGLDPQTPALAVARATRPDQQVIAASISELPAKLSLANMPGPVLVILGRVTAAAQALSAPAGSRAA